MTDEPIEALGEIRARDLIDAAALVANQEHHHFAWRMEMRAGQKSVAARQLVGEALGEQKIERAIDSDRRHAAGATLADHLDQIISADRSVRRIKRLKHSAADRRQAHAARPAKPLGLRQRFRRAARVIMGVGARRAMRRAMILAVIMAMVVGVLMKLGHGSS